jgi:hypothetical protein
MLLRCMANGKIKGDEKRDPLMEDGVVDCPALGGFVELHGDARSEKFRGGPTAKKYFVSARGQSDPPLKRRLFSHAWERGPN